MFVLVLDSRCTCHIEFKMCSEEMNLLGVNPYISYVFEGEEMKIKNKKMKDIKVKKWAST